MITITTTTYFNPSTDIYNCDLFALFCLVIPCRCEEYVGSTCDEHLKGIQIFIENSTDRTMMDEVARTALAKLDGASEDCQNAASAMICQWVFKPCHVQEWVNSKRAVPRPICQEDCNTVRDQACLDVWKTVEDFFEECKDVVVNTSCEHLPRANGGDFAECVSYGALGMLCIM